MRAVQTFVLKLLLDTERPGELRGLLCSVSDNAEYTFSDAESLLVLLRQFAGAREGPRADEPPPAVPEKH